MAIYWKLQNILSGRIKAWRKERREKRRRSLIALKRINSRRNQKATRRNWISREMSCPIRNFKRPMSQNIWKTWTK